MFKFGIPLLLASSFIPGSVIAGTMGPEIPAWTWVAAFSAGPVWPQGNNVIDTFYLTSDIEKSYVVNPSTNSLFYGELFLGAQRVLTDRFQGQFGVAVAATSNLNVDGVVWDDANPLFQNFSFAYQLQHTHVAAKAKLLADMGFWCIPWISGSVGVGFNTSRSYNAVPLIFEAIPTPNFTNNTTTSFTYTVGAGVQRVLTPHWQVGAGYEFADWGNSGLNPAPFQTTNSSINLDHIYTNGVIFNLTYIA